MPNNRGAAASQQPPSVKVISNPAVRSFMAQAQALFQTGDPVLSKEQTLQTLETLRQQQALSLAYFDCFWLMAIVMLALAPVVIFMKRSVAEKGARISTE